MPTATLVQPQKSLADVLHDLGDIAPERIGPPFGTATEQDLIDALEAADKKLYELIDGFLVEKVMGFKEAFLAVLLARYISEYLDDSNLGLVVGADGPFRLRPKRVRLPDVGFITWDRLDCDEMPNNPILDAVPEVAAEVISQGNTKGEMERKLQDYFQAGVLLVWFVYPKTQTIHVYTSPTTKKILSKEQTLEGGKVLPGFALPLKKLFTSPRRPSKGRKKHD